MKTYLEIKVPISYDDPWFCELRESLKPIPVHWQNGYYHVTMAFLDQTYKLSDVKAIMHKYLDNAKAVNITFDKLDVFTTNSGMLIIHLTANSIPETFQTMVEDIRGEINHTKSKIQSGFLFHVTLGRISEPSTDVDVIRGLIGKVNLPPFTLSLNEVEYREFRGRSIYKNTLI